MSSATFETKPDTSETSCLVELIQFIYLFIVMLHATTRNLNCFTNNQILHTLKLHLHLQKHPHEATDMLNLFKTMIIPIILLALILHI
jgi:hypothetical protein